MAEKTAGENAFERYLNENKIRFDFEPSLGPSVHPDYLVHAARGDVLCEIEDFGEGGIDLQVQTQAKAHQVKLPDGTDVGGVAVGAWDPFERVEAKIRAGAKQLTSFRGQYPSFVILFNPGYIVDLVEFVVLGAMAEVLRPRQNTTISDIAVLEIIHPNEHFPTRAMRARGSALVIWLRTTYIALRN